MTENIAIQPATAEVQARIRASFERQGLMRHLGACQTLSLGRQGLQGGRRPISRYLVRR
jgi:hypothetical protein